MPVLNIGIQQPALYVRLAGHPGFPLFDVNSEDGFEARELTARQVDDVARQRGLRVVPVLDSTQPPATLSDR